MAIDYEQQIEKLNKIGIALSAEHDLSKLLDMIVTETRAFTNSDAGSLYIKEDNMLSFRVAQNETLWSRLGQENVSFKSFKVPITRESFSGYVATTGKTLNIPDVYQIPETAEYSAKTTIQYDKPFEQLLNVINQPRIRDRHCCLRRERLNQIFINEVIGYKISVLIHSIHKL